MSLTCLFPGGAEGGGDGAPGIPSLMTDQDGWRIKGRGGEQRAPPVTGAKQAMFALAEMSAPTPEDGSRPGQPQVPRSRVICAQGGPQSQRVGDRCCAPPILPAPGNLKARNQLHRFRITYPRHPTEYESAPNKGLKNVQSR